MWPEGNYCQIGGSILNLLAAWTPWSKSSIRNAGRGPTNGIVGAHPTCVRFGDGIAQGRAEFSLCSWAGTRKFRSRVPRGYEMPFGHGGAGGAGTRSVHLTSPCRSQGPRGHRGLRQVFSHQISGYSFQRRALTHSKPLMHFPGGDFMG